MKLEVHSVWSTDLNPPSSGEPDDLESFEVGVHVSIGERDQPGGEVFFLTACSPNTLAQSESGRFISHTLVLERISWLALTARIEKLLRHAESCTTWSEVVAKLSGCLRYADE